MVKGTPTVFGPHTLKRVLVARKVTSGEQRIPLWFVARLDVGVLKDSHPGRKKRRVYLTSDPFTHLASELCC